MIIIHIFAYTCNMPGFKLPTAIDFALSLPRNPAGKALRGIVCDRYGNIRFGTSPKAPRARRLLARRRWKTAAGTPCRPC